MATIFEALEIAVAYHQAGELQAAEQVYRQVLAADPNCADALHLIGLIASQTGQHELAVEYFGRAIELNGNQPAFHCNLGNALQAQGKLDKAVASYRRSLSLKPDHVEALNNLGNALKFQGKLDEAIECYRRAVERNPDQAEVHCNLGVALKDLERLDEAVACFHRALELNPKDGETHNNLGNALKEQRKLDAAIASFRQALTLKSGFPEAHSNLGTALQLQGKLDEAVACFCRSLEQRPDYAVAHHNLGTAFQIQGKLEEAIASYRRALDLNPNYSEAHYNLANAFKEQGKLDDAVANYRRALALKPDFAKAHNNLGTTLKEQERLEEAVACFRRAVELNPELTVAHSNLGNTLRVQGKLEEAVGSFRRARDLTPSDAEAHFGLGVALQNQGKLDEAVASYRRALELKPHFVRAHNNLGIAFQAQEELDEAFNSYRRALELEPDCAEAHCNLGNALKDQGRLEEAIESFRRAVEFRQDFVAAHSNLLYTLCLCPNYDVATIYAEHCLWNRQHAESVARFIKPHVNDTNAGRRLRIGYVSPNFRIHAEALFLAPLFSSHDHRQFEVFCYSDVVSPDDITAKLQSYSDVWRATNGFSDERVAQMVREDRIDILVDLTMHMANGRPLLFARKPAPVQVCWLAYQGTTGLSTMDYRLTDPHLDPPGLFDRYYSEESVRLPDSFWCYDPLTNGLAVNRLPELENGYVTFGSLNNFCKVTDDVLRVWARVLRAVDRSKLTILTGKGAHRQRTLSFLEREGIAPERITFERFMPRREYLNLYHQIDLALDTFPYNGQTTTLDAAWMGVPVVTIIGQTSTARAGASLLCNLEMPELVAESADQFVSIAVELANDLTRLGDLRASLRGRLEKSPLMDAPRFARNVEAAYRRMWQRWCARALSTLT